ncbi:MAG: ArsR/SmtB family transcription factor [Candidatus Helarchaeota archaeon]
MGKKSKWEQQDIDIIEACNNAVSDLPEHEQLQALENCYNLFSNRKVIKNIIDEIDSIKDDKEAITQACEFVNLTKPKEKVDSCVSKTLKKHQERGWENKTFKNKIKYIIKESIGCISDVPLDDSGNLDMEEAAKCLTEPDQQFISQLLLKDAVLSSRSPNSIIDDDIIGNIIDLILYTDMPQEKIANKCRISRSTVAKVGREILTKKNYKIRFPHGVVSKSKSKLGLSKELVKKNPEKVEKLKKIATYLLTDGSLPHQSSNLAFSNKSKILINKFKDLIKDLIPHAVFKISMHGVDGLTHTVHLISTDLADLLFELSPSFTTKPYKSMKECNRLNEDCFENLKYNKENKKCEPAFYTPASYQKIFNNGNIRTLLRIIADTEGNIYFHARPNKQRPDLKYKIDKKIGIAATHPILLQQINNMLHSLNIRTRLEPNNQCPNIIIIPPKDLEEFQRQVGFTRGVKISKKSQFWLDTNKSDLLDIATIFTKMIKNKSLKISKIDDLNQKLKEATNIYKDVADIQGIEKARKEAGYFLCDIQEVSDDVKSKCKDFVDIGFLSIDNRIMELLERQGHTANQLSKILNIDLSTIHKHLRILERNGKVKVLRKDGRNNIWGLSTGRVRDARLTIKDRVLALFRAWRHLNYLTSDKISNKLGVNQSTINKLLRELETEDKVKMIGKGPMSHKNRWVLTD